MTSRVTTHLTTDLGLTLFDCNMTLTLFDCNMTLLVNEKSQNTTSSPGLVNQLYMTLARLLTDFLFY